MEKRGVSAVLMVCLVFGILVGQSTAQAQGPILCYPPCFIGCIASGGSVFDCAFKCLKQCILPKSTVGGIKDTQYFCKLGCATALCTNISTKENPAEKKVGSCVDACSATCAKN